MTRIGNSSSHGIDTYLVDADGSCAFDKVENVTFPDIDPRIEFVVKPLGLRGDRQGNFR